MDYEAFHSMSPEVAQAYLLRFLEVEHDALRMISSTTEKTGVVFDYSLRTLPNCLQWFVNQFRIHFVPLPPEAPDWIRSAHPKGQMEFDDDSKTVLLRAGYYFGECFARLPGLRWTIGNEEYMHKHMPVVAGFRNDDELPPLVVVEVMFSKIATDRAPLTEFDETIEIWLRQLK